MNERAKSLSDMGRTGRKPAPEVALEEVSTGVRRNRSLDGGATAGIPSDGVANPNHRQMAGYKTKLR